MTDNDEPQYLAECCGTGRTPPCNACPKLKPALNVVAMPVRNLQDIPALLRNKADEIERGEMGDIRTYVLRCVPAYGRLPARVRLGRC